MKEDINLNYEDILKDLESIESIDKQLKFVLDQMKNLITDKEKIDFQLLWKVKNLCLDIFKKPISSSIRVLFWKKYLEISNEIQRTKQALEDLTAFESEQIDLVIQAIEKDIEKYNEVVQSIDSIEIDQTKTLSKDNKFYADIQRELNLLNAFSTRISSLKKEIIKTPIPISKKNKFLKKLEIIGDFVFPKRKELITSISEKFIKSIDYFINNIFNLKKVPFYVLKDEIKKLQNIAKKITIDSKTFLKCRLSLSNCWDEIKIAEKDFKKQRQFYKDNVSKVLFKVNILKDLYKTNSKEDKAKEEKEIFDFIKTLELRDEDIKFIKFKIKQAKAPLLEKKQKDVEERQKAKNDLENYRKDKLNQIQKSLNDLIDNVKNKSIEDLQKQHAFLETDIQKINLSSQERLILEKNLRKFYHLVEDKKENDNLVKESDLITLNKIFEIKKLRKSNFKKYLDGLNKELAGSSFDFDKAITYRDLIDSEKQNINDLEKSIEQIKEKISNLS